MKDKPVIEVQDTHLSRDLTQFHITMIGVGAMIGAGIFVLTGIAAGTAGPGLLLAFALNGGVTIFTAMVYAELGSAIPESGGGYLWIKEAFGGSQAFLAGWMSWFSHAVAGALYALGFGSYAALLLRHFGVPLFGLEPYLETGLAVGITLLFLLINFRGTSETGTAGSLVTLAKLAVIGVFIGFALWAAARQPDVARKFTPFLPKGMGGVFVAMGFTFIAFEGYEIIVQAGEEVVDPRRSIPKAVFWSLLIVVPIYVLVGFASLGAVRSGGPTWQYLAQFKELGLVRAAGQIMPFGTIVLLAGGLLSTVSALNATTFSSTRVAFAMGRDKALPAPFARIHPRTRTPYVALAGTGVIILLMVVAIPIEDVATAADVMFLLLFVQVNCAVLRIRREYGERLAYGYMVPLYPWVPLLGIALQVGLSVYLYRYRPAAWYLAAGWIAVGTGIFFAYARQRLREAEEPRVARTRIAQRHRQRGNPEVLVAVSETAPVEAELRVGAALARARQADLVAAHVVQVPRQTVPRAAAGKTAASTVLLKQLSRFADEEDLAVRTVIAVGHSVSRTLASLAAERAVPLVVLGWRGQIYERRIRGSVADAVLHASPAHVVLIRDRGLPETIEQVAVAQEPGVEPGLTVAVAVALARGFGARLRVLGYHAPEAEAADSDDWLRAMEDHCRESGLPPDRSTVELLPAEDRTQALVAAANQSDLFVMGASRDWVDPDHLLGLVPDRVANRSRTSVLVVKEEASKLRTFFRRFSAVLPGS